MGLKQDIEVILFWKEQSLTVKEISEILTEDTANIRAALKELIKEYEMRDSGLHINVYNGGYVLEPRPEYMKLAQRILPVEVKTSTTRTLALIALKEPVKQSEIVKERGSSAYDHIRDLLDLKWIKREPDPESTSYILRVTPDCKKYFGLTGDGKDLRNKLKEIEKERAAKEQEIEELSLDLDGGEITTNESKTFAQENNGLEVNNIEATITEEEASNTLS